MKAKSDPMTLVEQFAEAVAAQTDAIKTGGDPRDRHGKRYAAAFQKLRAMGDPGRDALATLFTHIRPDVRATAAVCLLRYRTDEALAILRKGAQGTGLEAFACQEALNRWEDGTWELDPPDEIVTRSDEK